MHKQQRRRDVRLRGCPTCWLNLRLHGRTRLFAPHVCVCVCACAPVYSMNVFMCAHCTIFKKRLVEFKQGSWAIVVCIVSAVNV